MRARDRIAISVVGGTLLLAGLWFLLISPVREEASTLGAQVDKAQAALDEARSSLARFQQARAEYPENYAMLAAVGKATPPQDATATLLYQLSSTARKQDVGFRSFAPGGGEATPAGSAGGPSAPAGSGGGQASPAGAQAASGAATQTLPAKSFSFDYLGPFFRLADFLGALQGYVEVSEGGLEVDGRLLRIDGFSLTPDEGAKKVTASIQATAFTLPEGQSPLGGATPAGPPGASPAGPAGTSSAPPAEGAGGAPSNPAVATGGTP